MGEHGPDPAHVTGPVVVDVPQDPRRADHVDAPEGLGANNAVDPGDTAS